MRAAAAIALLPLAALAGCGDEKTTIRPEGAEKTIVDFVRQQTGFRVTDPDCPSGVEAKVGKKFQCSFTGPEGPYIAFMEVRKVEGEKVIFRIDTRRDRR